MTTISKLKELVDLAFYYKEQHRLAKAAATAEHQKYVKACGDVMDTLEEEGLDKFTTEAGTFGTAVQQTVKFPAEKRDQTLFFDYLKEKDIVWDMVTVPHQRMNAWAKSEFEAHGPEHEIPGLTKGDPIIRPVLRKG